MNYKCSILKKLSCKKICITGKVTKGTIQSFKDILSKFYLLLYFHLFNVSYSFGSDLGPQPDCYRSGVTFVSDTGLSYTTPHQSDTQRSG